MLEERSLKLMHILIKRNHHFVPELMEQLVSSKRQVEYTLDKINQLIDPPHQITIMENQHIVLSLNTKERLLHLLSQQASMKNYVMRPHEREKYLFLLLFYYHDRYFSLDSFMTDLKVSKSTILKDIKNLTDNMEKETIQLVYTRRNGYYLLADELGIRTYFIKMLLKDLYPSYNTLVYDFFIEKEKITTMKILQKVLQPLFTEYQLSLAEPRLIEFTYIFIFIKSRLNLKITEKYQQFHQSILIQMKEYAFSQKLLAFFDLVSNYANLYLCAYLLGLSSEHPDTKTKDYETIITFVRQIIYRFESLSGIRFSSHHDVINQIYPHLRPAYYRIYFNLPIINPLRDKIKEEYIDLFYLVYEALKPITLSFKQTIPDDEVAFLTMHFATLINKLEENSTMPIVALIVCNHGIGSSAIVHKELQKLFPEFTFLESLESQKIDEFHNSYDLIFSTIPNVHLFYHKKPIYVIPPIMSMSEKYRLVQDVYSQLKVIHHHFPSIQDVMQSIKKYADIYDIPRLEQELYEKIMYSTRQTNHLLSNYELDLDHLIDQDLIQLDVTAHNWQEAIRLAAAPLLAKNRITPAYIETIIENAQAERSYMVITKHVALPHARPSSGVLELGISIAVLRNPIIFGNVKNDPVKYIFCLAGSADLQHLNAMHQLVTLLSDPKFYDVLESRYNVEEIYNYIRGKI